VLQGLGNYTKETVGSGGLSTMFYRCNSWGGSIQYGYDAGIHVLFEAGLTSHSTDVTQSASQPQIMGSTAVLDYDASLQILYGNSNHLDKVTADFHHRSTKGTEYTTVWSSSTNTWDVKTQAVMSEYSTTVASLAYDRYILEADSYSWKLHFGLSYSGKNDEYLLPASYMKYSNVAADIAVQRCFDLGLNKHLYCSLLAKYNKNIDGEYSYSGIRSSDAPAREWYPHDIKILSSDYFKVGTDISLILPLRKKMNLQPKAQFAYLGAQIV